MMIKHGPVRWLERERAQSGKRSHRLPHLICLVLTLVVGTLACSRDFQSSDGASVAGGLPAPAVGFLAPDFSLVDLNGNKVSLSGLRGRTVFINFWATT